MLIVKNRNREVADFANINLLGECNANCFFCLGKDISAELYGKNQLNVHYNEWKSFSEFLSICKNNNIKKIYFTGQTADGLQYKYLQEAINFLHRENFTVGVRTNGLLAEQKINIIKQFSGGIGYSIHSLNIRSNYKITGSYIIPNWDKIIPLSGNNVRVSIVLCKYNINEFFDIIKYLSKFNNVRYIQVRRISTDTRYEELKSHIVLYEELYKEINNIFNSYGNFYGAQQFNICGKEVNFWRTVETTVNSFNYFTDGTISKEYFIVEGYLKHRKNDIQPEE